MTTIAMTDFAAGRHFMNPDFGGTKVPGTPEHFLQQVTDAMLFDARFCEVPQVVQADGFAPFVRHFFIKVGPEFAAGTLAGVIATEGIEDMLQTGYELRERALEGELPYLTRWFPREHVTVPEAEWLDLVCYSRAQLEEEGMPIEADWGIVSINSEPLPQESPPTPATLLRNAQGKEYGGNGQPIDRERFLAAVAHWTRYAIVR